MKILVAADSFKESLTSLEVANTIEQAFNDAGVKSTFEKVSISDGGEGFVDSLVQATKGTIETVSVLDSLNDKIDAFYGLSGDKETAFIEMAAANGLESISPEKRNPLVTTTFGTGELIIDAINKGAKKIVMGLGGSATNDGGAGMARALGVRFLDNNGDELDGSGGSLARLYSIDDTNIDPRIKEIEFFVASDVDNPLCGQDGAANVYARQKGADDEMVLLLEKNLSRYAEVLENKYKVNVSSVPGAGAAGGLGTGLLVFTNAQFKSGIETVLDFHHFTERLEGVDLLITGEGRIDGQTIYGKAPIGIAKLGKEKGIKVIAFCGVTGEGYEEVYKHGIDEVHQIVTVNKPIEVLLKEGKENLYKKALEVAKTYL